MGRKKKKQLKPWCWYCNREFDDEKILIQHQKSKHFKCTFCHKKLYTGPGLSIHSMQVHKEKIDKIPFALPQRCNVDLEIYGMEGIPDEDIKEHERHKSGKEDEVDEKRIKIEFPQILPPFPLHNMSMPTGLQYMPSISLPVMPPPLPFGLAPPIFVTRPTISSLLPHSMTTINPMVSISQNQPVFTHAVTNCHDQMKDNNNIPPPPPPPPIKVEETIQKSTPQTAIFPAYSINTEAAKVISKVTQPTSSTPNMKVILVHPEDDLPLEQIRLRLAKYSPFINPIKSTPTELSWTTSSPQQNHSVAHTETKMIPPPPPPNHLQMHQNISQFERALPTRPWVAPHIVQFTKPLNFGGQGYY